MDSDLLRIPVGPGSVHVERYGRGGQPIVLLHGFGTCSFLWREVGPRLAESNRTAFAIDLFGHGESDRPFDAPFGIAAQMQYVDNAMTALRIAKATVVGIDLGALVAMRLAALRAERVDRMVLVNPIGLDEVPAEDVRSLQANVGKFALRVSRGVLGAAPLIAELLKDGVARPENMPDPLIARYLAPFVGKEGIEHLLLLARSIDGEDMDDVDLGQLDQPTLIVWGDQDRFLPPKFPDRLADTIPGSRLVRLPTVARLVPEEAPDALAGMILDFVGASSVI